MSDQIPPEVLGKILMLCELPTILRCRSVSRQWRAFIDDPHFVQQHLDYLMQTNSTHLFCLAPFGHTPLESLLLRLFPIIPIITQVEPASFVGSCNGLLCLRNEKTPDFCIMNLATKKHIYLPRLLPKFCQDDGYGFGYDSVSHGYKVVRIARKKLDSTCVGSEMVVCCVKTRGLKFLKVPYYISCNNNKMGTFVGGALHWVTVKCDELMNQKNNLILRYDLSTDELRELPQPDLMGNCTVCVGLCGTLLCLSANYGDELGVDLWVMKKYGVKQSWTKLFQFAVGIKGINLVRPLGLVENGNLVIVEMDHSRLAWIDRKKKKIINFSWKGRSHEIVVCAKSIAPLPANENKLTDEKDPSLKSNDTRKKKK